MSELIDKTRKGLVWSSIERFASQGVQFLFSVLLARILSPQDYGIIAMPLVFLALAQCFIDSGFSTALIRKKDLNDEDLSTAFYFNILVGLVCYFALFFSSPLIANFYNTPILADVLKVTALATLFNPLCAVPQAILTKRIDFKSQALVTTMGSIASGILGLILALNGFGLWALVFQQVGGYAVRTVLLWTMVKWRPELKWSKQSFHYLWDFGSKILASGIIDTLYNNMFFVVIGRFFSPLDLGFYTRAQQFSSLPASNITGIIQRVTFPVLSSIQDDDERLKKNYRRILRLTAYIMFPLMIGLSAVSYPFVRVLLTDKWIECAFLLQIICFSMMWFPIHSINLNLLVVKGRSDVFFKLEIIKKCFGISVLCVTIPYGIAWMVFGSVVTSLFALIVNTYYTGKLIHVGYFRQMLDMLPIIGVCLLMWFSIRGIFVLVENDLAQLACGILVGFIVYFVGSKLILKNEYDEAMNFVLSKMKRN